MHTVRDAVWNLVDRSVESTEGRGDTQLRTVVISAGPAIVQWPAALTISLTQPLIPARRTPCSRVSAKVTIRDDVRSWCRARPCR